VFCRFAGCNLWTGREQDRPSRLHLLRHRLRGHGRRGRRQVRHGLDDLADAVEAPGPVARTIAWWSAPAASLCCSWTTALAIDALHARGFMIALETNGTVRRPTGIDWICVSPKADAARRPDHGARN
jgi:7-carboxy-7-deazaguanine synthase